MNTYPGRNRGFTLVECLISVALIGVLVSLLAVALQRIRVRALGVQNLRNQQEIIRALIQSSFDNRGALPYCDQGWKVKLSYPRYLAAQGYITDYRVLFSPLAGKWYQRSNQMAGLKNPEIPTEEPWCYTNYGASRRGAMPHSVDDGGRKPARLPIVAQDGNLSQLMVLCDTYLSSYDTPQQNFGGGIHYFSAGASGWRHYPPEARTFGGYVYASFADGHVERFTRAQILVLDKQDVTKAPFFEGRYTQY